jgi:hypothetical protein
MLTELGNRQHPSCHTNGLVEVTFENAGQSSALDLSYFVDSRLAQYVVSPGYSGLL